MIHLILVDRDGIMGFACDEIELFTTQGATRDIFKMLLRHNAPSADSKEGCCPYCVKTLSQNSGVRR